MSERFNRLLSRSTDYRSISDYWDRYSIAEKESLDAVKIVNKAIFEEAKDDYKLITEMALVLIYKIVDCNEKPSKKRLCGFYRDFYEEVNSYAVTHLKANKLDYYFAVTE